MSILSSFPRMVAATTAANAMVMRNASTKLGQWMSRPNMTASTSAVVTTKFSRKTPSPRPMSAPSAARISISLNM